MSLLALTACGTLEVGIERTATPTATAVAAATATPAPTVTAAMIVLATDAARPTADVATPTQAATPTPALQPTVSPTPAPTLTPTRESSPLRVAFVKDGNVWLWTERPALSADGTSDAEGQEATALTSAGGVSDVKISDDGPIVAFIRGLELWAVNSDATGERTLISIEDIAAMVEPGDPGVRLYHFEWVPGTHVVAFNTHVHLEVGLVLNDDLRLVDADTLEQTVLLPRGKGGQFYYSPDGRQIAVVRSGTITLIDADGGNPRDALTYTPPVTRSEYQYYARPVWAADSESLRVTIPPADPYAQPPQFTTVWHTRTDGRPAGLIATIAAKPLSQPAFSPDLSHVAYLEQPEGALPGSSEGSLLITDLDSKETVTYHPQAGLVYGWAPDSQHFAFLTHPQLPQAQIGKLSDDPVPAYGDPDVAAIDVLWVDADRYFFIAITSQGRSLLLGGTGGTSTVVATVTGRSLPYDFAR